MEVQNPACDKSDEDGADRERRFRGSGGSADRAFERLEWFDLSGVSWKRSGLELTRHRLARLTAECMNIGRCIRDRDGQETDRAEHRHQGDEAYGKEIDGERPAPVTVPAAAADQEHDDHDDQDERNERREQALHHESACARHRPSFDRPGGVYDRVALEGYRPSGGPPIRQEVGSTDNAAKRPSEERPVESNQRLIEDFYTAFQRRDPAAMVACYDPDITFSDPAFGELKGARAGAMWKMLAGRAEDLKVEFRDVSADDRAGRAHWDAWYTFSGTGRAVHNSIDAAFEFKNGKIIRHTDSFDLHKWASQALGLPGRLFGGLPFFQKKIRATAIKGLDHFLKS
jgi:ketosteroid isomerase-like protein